MAQFPSKPVAQLSYDYRTLGLGYANLGALLMVQGIPYDSPEGRAQCGGLDVHHACLLLRDLRRDRGRSRAVPALRRQPRRHAARRPQSPPGRLQRAGCGIRRPDDHARRHRPEALPGLSAGSGPRKTAIACWLSAKSTAIRNAQVTVIAPTGTIGLVMDCDTTGIEPDFALVKFKKLAGGGYFKIINASIPPALARLGYTPKQIEEIVRYCRGAGTLAGCPHINPAVAARPRASPTKRCRQIESQPAGRLRDCRSSSTAGRSATTSCATSSASSRSSSTRRASTCSPPSASARAQIAEAKPVRLRHHDHRRRAAPEDGASTPSSTAPTSAASIGQRFLSADRTSA